MALFDRPYIAP